MSELQKPERLLSDALRAQARSAPPGATGRPAPATNLPPRYGLLSGTGAGALARESASLPPAETRPAAPAPVRAKRSSEPLPTYWILLLAVLLGLATGAVIGLITLV